MIYTGIRFTVGPGECAPKWFASILIGGLIVRYGSIKVIFYSFQVESTKLAKSIIMLVCEEWFYCPAGVYLSMFVAFFVG